jgi:hypothetical protein
VQPLPGTIRGASDPFVATQWSVILAAGESQSAPEMARAALGELCQIYWPTCAATPLGCGRYRETLCAEVRRTVERESEGELHEFLRVLTDR